LLHPKDQQGVRLYVSVTKYVAGISAAFPVAATYQAPVYIYLVKEANAIREQTALGIHIHTSSLALKIELKII
jgi:hypothetical protein